MKKGDLKRNSILAAAERLFFEKGYEQTSIQDILDELSLSKGGFYHHFASKEAILAEICENRVADRLDRLRLELFGARQSPIEKLNLLLRMVNLFDWEDPRFVALMLKICYLNRDVRIRDHMRMLVLGRLGPLMDELVREGMDSGLFYTRHPGKIGAIVLSMAANADDEACRMLAKDADNPECIIDIAEMLNACRDAIEMLLNAPFGSVALFNPDRLVGDYRAAAVELLKLEAR